MKAYLLTILIIDHDELGSEGIKEVIENTSYANDCICPSIQEIKEADIGEWHDEHPLNTEGRELEVQRLFSGIL